MPWRRSAWIAGVADTVDVSEAIQRADRQRLSAPCVDRRCGWTTGRAFEGWSRVLQLRPRLVQVHVAERQHGVPERELTPAMLAIAHRSQMPRAETQPLFAP